MKDPWPEPGSERDTICRGQGPWVPWHYVGLYVVSPEQVRPGMLEHMSENDARKAFVTKQIMAVLVTTAAIHRMMGKDASTGFEG